MRLHAPLQHPVHFPLCSIDSSAAHFVAAKWKINDFSNALVKEVEIGATVLATYNSS